jgi:hypothetical protein
MTTPAIRNMQRRLRAWELPHLRQHAADLAERLEAAEKRATDAEERASAAEASCDFWHDQAIEMHRAAAEGSGGTPGLTVDGALVIVRTQEGGAHVAG